MRLQMEVTGMDFATSLVLFTSLSTISAEYCEEYSLFMSYSGRYCTGEGDSNLVMPALHCQATCLQSAICNAYNYNVSKGICTCFTSPCPEAKSDPIMEFVVFTKKPSQGCYEWVPYSAGDTADDRMIYTDNPRHIISRMQRDGNDVGVIFTPSLPLVMLVLEALNFIIKKATLVNVCRSRKAVPSSGFPTSPVIQYHQELS